jgi:hydroxypyruvate isomerase
MPAGAVSSSQPGSGRRGVKGELANRLSQQMPRIAHIQVVGVPDRHASDDGELNYRYLSWLIDALGCPGRRGCEDGARGGTEAGLGWLTLASR